MAVEQYIHLELDDELDEEVDQKLFDYVNNGIQGAVNRDSYLQIWRDLMEGLGQSSDNPNWKNACDLSDTIVFRNFLSTLAAFEEANAKDPHVAVEAFDPDHEQGAEVMEAWLSMKMSQSDIDNHKYYMEYATLRDPVGIAFLGWKQNYRRVREKAVIDPDTGLEVDPSQNSEDKEYDYVTVVREDVLEEGFNARQVDLANFYVYPADAKTIEDAICVFERMRFTEHDLINAIEDLDFDEESVLEVIKTQQTGPATDYLRTQANSDGVDPEVTTGGDGYYEIFVGYSRMPMFVSTEGEIPKKLKQYKDDDFCFALHLGSNTMLRKDFSDVKERPYWATYMLPRTADTFYGHCIPAMLEGLAAEANAILRFGIDRMNLINMPAQKVRKGAEDDVRKIGLGPGSLIPLDDPEADLVPLIFDHSGSVDIAQASALVNGKADGLISAEGLGALPMKQRKAAEIQNVQSAAANKFGLYLRNFNRTYWPELARRMVHLYSIYHQEDSEIFSDNDGNQRTMTMDDLKGNYRFVPTAVSTNTSPEARLQMQEFAAAQQEKYFMLLTQFPQKAKLLWHQYRKVLMDAGDTNPEAIIGKEPDDMPAPVPGQPGQQGAPIPGQQAQPQAQPAQ